MCLSSEIRQLIGKNTKFKIMSIFCSGIRNWSFLSFIILAALFRVSSGDSLAVEDVNLSKLVHKANVESTEYFNTSQSWFAGNYPFPERPNKTSSTTGKSGKFNTADYLFRQTRDFIKKHARVYQMLVSDAHSLPPKGNDDSQPERGSQNTTWFSNTNTVEKNDDIHRFKRDVIKAESTNFLKREKKSFNHESEGTFVVNQVDRTTSQHFDKTSAIDINCQRIAQRSFVFSIEDDKENGFRELLMYQSTEGDIIQPALIQTKVPDAESVDVIQIGAENYVLATVNHELRTLDSADTIDTGSVLYRINWNTKTFEKTQTIHMPFARSSAFWTGSGEGTNDVYLALAPEKALSDSGITYKVSISCYRWQGAHFDYVSQVPASNPQAVKHFSMFSHDYLAVANYQDDTGSTSIQSELFKYNHQEDSFTPFQKFKTFGARDISHFKIESFDGQRQEHFLAIANHCKKDEKGVEHFHVQSTIMKFSEVRFVTFKVFYGYGVVQVLPVQHQDKFFLTVADLIGLRIFQYNGWNFVETYSTPYDTPQQSPFSIRLRQLHADDQSYFSVATTSKGVTNGIYSVAFETRNDHRKLVTSVGNWCKGATKQMQNKPLSTLESQIDSVPKVTDRRVVIKGAITFSRAINVNNLQSRALQVRGRSLGEDEFQTLAANEKKFRGLQQQMGILNFRLGGVVWTNSETEQVITGKLMFDNVFYENPNFQVTNMMVDRLGSRQVSDKLNNLVFLNQAQSFKRVETSSIRGNDILFKSLNDKPLWDYALRNPEKNQVFLGRNSFVSDVLVTDTVTTQGRFAGVNFNEPVPFLLANGNQSFPNVVMKLNGVSVNDLFTTFFNTMDLSVIFRDAVPLSGGVITAEKTFQQMIIQNADVVSINQFNINDLYAKAIYTDGRFPQSFLGATYFENLQVDRLLPTNSQINLKTDLSSDFIKIQNGNYKLKDLTITTGTHVADLVVKNQLNNIEVVDGKLNCLFANSMEPQRIQLKTLDAVKFNRDVEANELVDNVPLSTWSPTQRIQLTNNVIQGVLNVNSKVKAMKGIRASKSFQQNSEDVLRVLRTSARTDSEMLPSTCSLRFEDLTVNGDSDIKGKVNNIQPHQWVVNNPSGTDTITGEKVFKQGLHLSENCETKALYGSKVDNAENIFNALQNMLIDGVDQEISHDFAFTKGLFAENAFCPDAILNNVPFENLMFKKGDQTVHMASVFRQPFTSQGSATVLGDVSTVLINNIDLNRELPNTLRTGSDFKQQVVSGDYHFADLTAENSQVTGSFASSKVSSLFQNIILKIGNDVSGLNGNKITFAQGASVGSLKFTGKMNEIRNEDWGQQWLLSETDQTVHSKVAFTTSLEANSVTVPSVNGENINSLAANIVRTNEDVTLSHPVTFMNKVRADKGITMPSEAIVNGIDLRSDVLFKNSPNQQIISGDKRFLNGMTINGNLEAGQIEGFDIQSFAKLLKSDGSMERQSLIINGNVGATNEPLFQSKINGREWNELTRQYWFRDKPAVINSHVKFSSLALNGGTLKDGATFNGVDFKHFIQNYASKTRNQEWSGNVKFANVEQIRGLKAHSMTLNNGGLFNKVDMDNFHESVLRYNGAQSVFGSLNAKNIQVNRLDTSEDGTINSFLMQRDMMTINGENRFTSTKTFKNVIINTIMLSEDTTLDGVNMGEWNRNSVKLSGDFSEQTMGPVKFNSLKVTNNMIVEGKVDGHDFDQNHIFTTDHSQNIFGHVTFKNSESGLNSAALTAPNVFIVGTINGHDAKTTIENLAVNNANNDEVLTIKGTTTFDGPVHINKLQTESLFQGQNVNEAVGMITRAHSEIQKNTFKAHERYQGLLSVTNTLMQAAEKSATFLTCFSETQTIKGSPEYIKVLRHADNPMIIVGYKQSELITSEKWYSYSASVDFYQLQVGNRNQYEGSVVGISEFGRGKNLQFAVAVNSLGNDQPAQAALEVMNFVNNFEINKSPVKFSKTFILTSVDTGTSNARQAISQIVYSDGFKAIQSFDVMENNEFLSCMAATYETKQDTESTMRILCFDKQTDNVLNSVQEMKLDSPSLLSSLLLSKATILGILTKLESGQPEGLLEFWRNDGETSVQFSKSNCIPVFNAIGVEMISAEDDRTFLAVTSGALRGTEYKGSVFMYRYSTTTQQFEKTQTIPVDHPLEVKFQHLRTSGEVLAYVLCKSETNNVQVYKYKGLSGWNLAHEFTCEDATSMEVTDFFRDGKYRAQTVFGTPHQTKIYSAELIGQRVNLEEAVENEINVRFNSPNDDVEFL